jgi:hypothetical protein
MWMAEGAGDALNLIVRSAKWDNEKLSRGLDAA